MFYLLEDNRIIDSEKYEYVLIEEGCWLYSSEMKIKVFREGIGICLGKIKKQSANVYDLINWEEDLVKHRMNNFIWHCSVLNQTSDISEYIKNRIITAIYKPNSRGDYIKVWEKKMEV